MTFLSAHIDTEPIWRGGEQQVLYLLQGLKSRGYPVVLLSAPGSPLHDRAREAGIDTQDLTIRGEADLAAVFRLIQLLKRLRPALLHMHTSHAHAIGACAAWLAGNQAKCVISRRVDFSIFRHSFLGLNWIKYRWGVDIYLAVSNRVREVLVNDGIDPRRIRVVHDGVDPSRFDGANSNARSRLLKDWQLPSGIPLVGAVGALVAHKGFKFYLDAAKEVLKHRDCAFVLVGEGQLYEELSKRARELGIDHRVRLVGFRSDIGDILHALDVYVSSSVEEGLGSSLLDALLLERPVVGTRAGGTPEVLCHDKNGLLVEPANGAALAGAIEELLSNPERGHRLAAEGRRTVLDSFSAENMVEKTLECYRDLLDGTCPLSPAG